MAFQISPNDTPDPFMIKFNKNYILAFTSGGDKVELWSSPYLHDFKEPHKSSRVIWFKTPELKDIWAPEIHIRDNTWYVYFAAALVPHGNETHRMYALKGPAATEDPMKPTSQFTFMDKIKGLPDTWAIDGTVFNLNNTWYMAYSGWPLDPHDPHAHDEMMQQILITRMTDPITSDGNVKMISMADNKWEQYTEDNGNQRYINEGPQWLEMQSFKGIIYSCGASWSPAPYLLGMLQYKQGDPLDKNSWTKSGPWLYDNRAAKVGPYSPGHCSFVPSPDNTQTWIVFHATPTDHEDKWNNRKGWVQPVVFNHGLPDAGTHPFAAGIYALPSGTQVVQPAAPEAPVVTPGPVVPGGGLVVQAGGKKFKARFKKFRLTVKKLFRVGGSRAS